MESVTIGVVIECKWKKMKLQCTFEKCVTEYFCSKNKVKPS